MNDLLSYMLSVITSLIVISMTLYYNYSVATSLIIGVMVFSYCRLTHEILQNRRLIEAKK